MQEQGNECGVRGGEDTGGRSRAEMIGRVQERI